MRFGYGILLLGAVALAQEGDRVAVQFADPARPGLLKGSLMNGCFNVEGYDGREVIVESRRGDKVRERRVPRGAEGLRRIDPSGMGVSVEVENNTATIKGSNVEGDLSVRVPRATSVKINCLNGGEMKLSGLTGDLEINNQNAGVSATGITGTVMAHSLNGKVTVVLDRITPGKPMSFSSLNGDIDVTLPADAKATLRARTDNGETYTDFEVQLQASKPVVEDNRASGGKYKVKTDRTMVGMVNGGGPELSFKTLNGNIYIRKHK